jgi:hypothetical protein
MPLTRSLLQVYAVTLVEFQGLGVHLPGDPQGHSPYHLVIRQENIIHLMLLLALRQIFGAVGADGENLVTHLQQLRFNAYQFPQLEVAIRSPSTTKINQYGRFAGQGFVQVKALAV